MDLRSQHSRCLSGEKKSPYRIVDVAAAVGRRLRDKSNGRRSLAATAKQKVLEGRVQVNGQLELSGGREFEWSFGSLLCSYTEGSSRRGFCRSRRGGSGDQRGIFLKVTFNGKGTL